MLDKLTAAVKQLLTDNRDFSTRLERLEKVKPAVVNGRDGKDGKDGVSPDIETIVAAVVNELPEPEKIDTKAIVNDVLAQIPKPRDGRDAPAVNVSDVAAIVLAKIPTPKDGKDGRNGPDLETVVKRVKAQVKDGSPGEPGPPGPPGKDGKDGVSVTNVQLKNNELFVWLDGVKRAVGKIKIPAATAPFNPGNGGGSAVSKDTVGYTPQGTFISSDLQAGVLDTPKTITFGAGGTSDNGGITIGADGVITVNEPFFWSIKQRFRAGRTGASGVSILFFWAEISVDGGSTWSVIGNSVSIPLSTASDTIVFFDLADAQFPPGTKLRNRFARSSTGDDSGDLRVGTPSAALQALNVPDAPSAQITMYAINE